MNTPVLLLLYNRPDYTKQLIKRLETVNPTQVFVAIDGPKPEPKDKALCLEVETIAKQANWNGEVTYLIREKNLGCRKAVSQAISWFFKNVDAGVILEDDCLPSSEFFAFSKELLERFHNNSEIFHISGANFTKGNFHFKYDYDFASIPHVWGWATWRRAWDFYEQTTANQDSINTLIASKRFFADDHINVYWKNILLNLNTNHTTTWDYIWVLTLLLNQGLSIYPSVNLVSNIGSIGTRSTNNKNPSLNIETNSLRLRHHPALIQKSDALDSFSYYNVFNSSSQKSLQRKRKWHFSKINW